MYIQSQSREEFVFLFVSGAELIGVCVKQLQNEEHFIHWSTSNYFIIKMS